MLIKLVKRHYLPTSYFNLCLLNKHHWHQPNNLSWNLSHTWSISVIPSQTIHQQALVIRTSNSAITHLPRTLTTTIPMPDPITTTSLLDNGKSSSTGPCTHISSVFQPIFHTTAWLFLLQYRLTPSSPRLPWLETFHIAFIVVLVTFFDFQS